MTERAQARNDAPRAWTLVAELTYACPLRCAYCSNPLDYERHPAELATADWCRVLEEAEGLGVVQVHLTGGEPLVRKDLEPLVAKARALGLYTNLVTSGVPLQRDRLAALRDAGLDHVQLSIQAAEREIAERVAGVAAFEHKLEVAAWIVELGLAFTLNCVLHRDNLDQVDDIVALAERLGADRLELANTQYLGWALANRGRLLPSAEQLERARARADAARRRLEGKMEILFVKPDYFGRYPRACMDGWGQRFLVVSPDGLALPCHAAHTIPGLVFDDVRRRPLAEIWASSPGFQAFRGEAWMRDPCRTCERRSVDFGGCRCQAYHLTGDAAATDPACVLAPTHALIEEARAARPPRGGADAPYLLRGPRQRPKGGPGQSSG
jgi:PqqA peptide cyclase